MSKYRIIRNLKIIIYIIRKAKLFGAFLFFLTVHWQSVAQGKLATHVNMPRFEQTSLREVFATLNEKYAIEFSYHSHLIQLDSSVSVRSYKGLCIDYLERILGGQYAFKETATHIIITYAPQRMDVVVDMNTDDRNRAVVSGYIRDLRTDEAIANASIYDKFTYDASTLSNQEGYFQLDIKKPEHVVAISLSKANYKDTSLMLLLPIDALKLSNKKMKMGFYREHDLEKNVFNNFFGRLFTNSSQRVHSMNLGGFFAYSPFQMSLTPGLSTHGFFESQVVNNFSLNVIGGSTAGVHGTELAGAFNVNQYDVHGAQFSGVFNVVGGHVRGLQMAGGANVILHNFYGTQIAGIWNNTDTLKRGIQLAGGVNLADGSHGMQTAGIANISRGIAGSQIAGGINIADKVSGIQLAGLLNVADSSDYPIAVFNFIRNGKKEVSIQLDESRLLSAHFRSGGRVLYSMLGLGRYIEHPDMGYAVEFGLGARLLEKRRFALATELVQRSNFNDKFRHQEAQRYALRVIPSVRLTNHWQIYFAPSFNYSEATSDLQIGRQWNVWGDKRNKNTLHFGGAVGLSFVF
ncbi:hypothetical protein [Sphingobacterium suaedae]|uniref:Carboxypeptidase-like regulatory domain-containing protein n=1 Tax=Sphingobacterium suaedae TaxID=1686402 RepID=A0ABW5KD83_9SPHI